MADQEEINKFLTEAMGECWHDFVRTCYCCPPCCSKCGADETNATVYNFDSDDWEGFGKLWEWAQKQEWWKTFIYEYYTQPAKNVGSELHMTQFIHPDRFADALYDFLQED